MSYDVSFYDQINEGALKSARAVIPVLNLYFNTGSIIDLGCGEGAWLSVFKEFGAHDILGIDGSYVDRNRLLIDSIEFEQRDLEEYDFPLGVERYDLALSLEVAEHLSSESAENFVDVLCDASDVVLFSAAIPKQRGNGHINCQWQSYWVDLFAKRKYDPLAAFRFLFWKNENVEIWYRQNMILYIEREYYKYKFNSIPEHWRTNVYDIVHPQEWMSYV